MNRRSRSRLMALVATASMVGTLVSAAPAWAAEATEATTTQEATPIIAPPPTTTKGDTPAIVSFKITQDEAVAKAKAAFTIPDGLELTVNKSSGQYGASWNLNWNSSDKTAQRISISVNVDGVTGVITNYYRYANNPEEQNLAPAVYSREDVAPVANEWLNKLAGDVKDTLRLVEQPLTFESWGPLQTSYAFTWQRVEQGYPARDGSIYITIDAKTKELLNFQRNVRPDLTYVKPDKLATQEQAYQAYRALPMQLTYQYYQQPGTTTGEWRLVYRPVTNFYPAVNQDGALVDYSGNPLDLKHFTGATPLPAPDKPYQAPLRPLTEQQALALAQQVAGRTDQPTGSNCNETSKGNEKSASCGFNWYTQGESNESYSTDVQIDLQKGVVSSYNSWGPYKPIAADEQIISEDEARKTAVEFIRTIRPDLVGSLMLMPPQSTAENAAMLAKVESWGVSFAQMKNGIPLADRQLSVQVDARTGKVRNFWGNDWGMDPKATFPQANFVIKPEAAVDSFLKVQGLELAWQINQPMYYPGKMPEPADTTKANLYWLPSSKLNIAVIDANTGAPLDYQGRNLIELTTKPTDIAGHFAQREIELLWSRGVFSLKDGKFNPNGTLSMAELSRWLILARGMQPYPMYNFATMGAGEAVAMKMAASDAAPFIGAALQNGIILPEDLSDDTDPDTAVTREQVALWAVRSMGYGAIAKMPNRIDMPFADKDQIGDRYANAVAILHGLGIVKGGSDSRFAPQRLITRGEAAKILFAVANQVRRYY